jgi:hypothetical protein
MQMKRQEYASRPQAENCGQSSGPKQSAHLTNQRIGTAWTFKSATMGDFLHVRPGFAS